MIGQKGESWPANNQCTLCTLNVVLCTAQGVLLLERFCGTVPVGS
jgi:hypothetical protein